MWLKDRVVIEGRVPDLLRKNGHSAAGTLSEWPSLDLRGKELAAQEENPELRCERAASRLHSIVVTFQRFIAFAVIRG